MRVPARRHFCPLTPPHSRPALFLSFFFFFFPSNLCSKHAGAPAKQNPNVCILVSSRVFAYSEQCVRLCPCSAG